MIAALLLLLQLLAPEAETRNGAEALRITATELAAEGDSTGALAALHASVSGGWQNADALVEASRLHTARGEAGLAVLASERAARLAPSSDAVRSARSAAYGLAGLPTPEASGVGLRSITARIGLWPLVAIALLLYGACLTLALLWRSRQRSVLKWSAAALAPVAVLAVLAAGTAMWEAGRPLGVALVTVEVRTDPSPEASGDDLIRAGETVRLRDTEGLWRQVQTESGEGWVPARAVERL